MKKLANPVLITAAGVLALFSMRSESSARQQANRGSETAGRGGDCRANAPIR